MVDTNVKNLESVISHTKSKRDASIIIWLRKCGYPKPHISFPQMKRLYLDLE